MAGQKKSLYEDSSKINAEGVALRSSLKKWRPTQGFPVNLVFTSAKIVQKFRVFSDWREKNEDNLLRNKL